MLPFYIYYSMFGFQRVGDQIWAAADQRARGFLLGATSGRTTLGGEGLQHQDGTSHLVAATIPNCKAYDPAFAGELAIIIDHGMREMLEQQRDVFYYVTMMNENYAQPTQATASAEGVIRGCYKWGQLMPKKPKKKTAAVTLMGSGAILTEVIKAAELLQADGIAVDIFSVTSWSELARDGMATDNSGNNGTGTPYLTQQLLDSKGPIIAASDYVRAVPETVRAYVPANRTFRTLGTDGFGRSDTRAALRAFFQVDAASIAAAAHNALK